MGIVVYICVNTHVSRHFIADRRQKELEYEIIPVYNFKIVSLTFCVHLFSHDNFYDYTISKDYCSLYCIETSQFISWIITLLFDIWI